MSELILSFNAEKYAPEVGVLREKFKFKQIKKQ
jgi:hypothetical protein